MYSDILEELAKKWDVDMVSADMLMQAGIKTDEFDQVKPAHNILGKVWWSLHKLLRVNSPQHTDTEVCKLLLTLIRNK